MKEEVVPQLVNSVYPSMLIFVAEPVVGLKYHVQVCIQRDAFEPSNLYFDFLSLSYVAWRYAYRLVLL